MGEEIKGKEKMEINNGIEALNEEDLGEVVGGGLIGKIKEKHQTAQASKELSNLLGEDVSLNDLLEFYNKSPQKEWEILLVDMAKRYPNISKLDPFRNKKY